MYGFTKDARTIKGKPLDLKTRNLNQLINQLNQINEQLQVWSIPCSGQFLGPI